VIDWSNDLLIALLVATIETVIVVPLGFFIGMRLFTHFLPGFIQKVADDEEILEEVRKLLIKFFPKAGALLSGKPPTIKQAIGIGLTMVLQRFLGGGGSPPTPPVG
jgi:hypothetical protein